MIRRRRIDPTTSFRLSPPCHTSAPQVLWECVQSEPGCRAPTFPSSPHLFCSESHQTHYFRPYSLRLRRRPQQAVPIMEVALPFIAATAIIGVTMIIVLFAVRNPTNPYIVEANRWQTLIGASLGFTGVILTLFANSAIQENVRSKTERAQKNSLFLALLGELERHLSYITHSSDRILHYAKEKRIGSDKFDQGECSVLAAMSKDLQPPPSPILFPATTKEMTTLPPDMVDKLLTRYRIADIYFYQLSHFTPEACSRGYAKDVLATFSTNHKNLLYDHAEVLDLMKQITKPAQ